MRKINVKHVMERKSFEKEKSSKFILIKVDRKMGGFFFVEMNGVFLCRYGRWKENCI